MHFTGQAYIIAADGNGGGEPAYFMIKRSRTVTVPEVRQFHRAKAALWQLALGLLSNMTACSHVRNGSSCRIQCEKERTAVAGGTEGTEPACVGCKQKA